MTKPLPAGQVSSITLGDCSAAVQETGAQGLRCSPDPSAQHGCGSEVGSAMPPQGPVTWCRDAQPSPGQARPGYRGPLIAQLRCSAQPFILPENISVRVLLSGAQKTGLVMFQSTASQSSQCAGWEGLSTWWEIQAALQRGRMPTVKGRTALQWLLLLTIYNQSHNQSYTQGLSIFFKYFSNILDTNRPIKILGNCR